MNESPVQNISAPRLPGWARPKGPIPQDDNAAFYAGAALGALDPWARSETSFSGLWRSRLALAAAAAQMRMMGRRETEAELRDAIALRTNGDEVDGRAGGVLNAWRQLAKGSAAGLVTLIGPTARQLGLNLGDELNALAAIATRAAADNRAPLHAVAELVAEVRRAHPRADFLGLWIADAVLAYKLRWPIPLPLLVTGLAQQRGRIAPGSEFGRICAAYAVAAAAAIDLHQDLARRTAVLIEAAPSLRAKGATAVVNALLDDDAIAPGACIGGMSDRGMRRLCDRLVTLGVARELTGRHVFRLYGL